MSEGLGIWWNVQRLLRPGGHALGRALDATAADGWTAQSYRRKVHITAAVLRQVAGTEKPLLIGLCEVENESVTRDLLAATGWDLETVRDPAARLLGDDVVLLYDQKRLTLDGPPASYNVHNRYTTRDILEAPFRTRTGNPLIVLANHWPSRLISNSEPLRIGLADFCRRIVERHLKFSKDELLTDAGRPKIPTRARLSERAETPVLVFGDFNDDPFDDSVQGVLGASRNQTHVSGALRIPHGKDRAALDAYLSMEVSLYNPTWASFLSVQGPLGTTYWNGSWYLLDQIALSRGFLGQGPVRWVDGSLKIHAIREILLADGTHVPTTTRGDIPIPHDPKTGNGVSDHLPLSFRLDLN